MATHDATAVTPITSATAMNAMPSPPLLVSVAAVCSARAACAPLEHVARLVDSFLDPSPRLSLPQAVASGSVRLLKRVLFRQCNDASVDVFLQQRHLRKAMLEAMTRGEMEMMELLHAQYPDFRATTALTLAAARGDLKMTQWLETHRHGESIESIPDALLQAVEHGHLDVVRHLMGSYNTTPADVYCPSGAL